jgi:predicted transporter
MDINMVLWLGGMLFSLSVFVVKVGFGLGLGRLGWRGVLLTLFSYLGIFLLTALGCESLIKILAPVVRQGPYLHALMALGMMAWGLYVLRKLAGPGPAGGLPAHRRHHQTQDSDRLAQHSTLILLLPCPVCLTAITFSTWAALQVIKMPAVVVGLGLGLTFMVLALLVYLFIRIFALKSTLVNNRMALGLSMLGLGLYFLTSLVIPAHIEAAKTIYQSFATEGGNIALGDHLGVFLLLLGAVLVGFFTNKRREVSE